MTERKHTPLPWSVTKTEYRNIGQRVEIIANSRSGVEGYYCICHVLSVGASTPEKVEGNAEFIVRACNSFYDLIDALEVEDDAKRLNAPDFVAKHGHDLVGMNSPARKKLRREALAKARGETE